MLHGNWYRTPVYFELAVSASYTRGHLRSIEIHHAIALDGRITSKREVTKGKAELIGGLFGLVQIEALMEEADWEAGNIYSNFCPFN